MRVERRCPEGGTFEVRAEVCPSRLRLGDRWLDPRPYVESGEAQVTCTGTAGTGFVAVDDFSWDVDEVAVEVSGYPTGPAGAFAGLEENAGTFEIVPAPGHDPGEHPGGRAGRLR